MTGPHERLDRVVGMAFGRWAALTPDLPGAVRREQLDYVPEHREEAWANLAWQTARETEWKRRPPELYDSPSPKAEVVPIRRPGSVRAALAPDGDPLREISPPVYFAVLTGADVPATGGKVSCPAPGHEDRHPSCQVYPDPDRGWFCFACGAGGSIYDLAAELWGGDTRGENFKRLRLALLEELAA